MSEILYPIKEAARLLNRSPHTLRSWDRHADFPADLRAKRNDRNERVYSPELIEKIRVFLDTSDFRPGRGIPNYNPNPAERKAHLESLREAAAKRGPMKALVSGTEGNVLSFIELVGGASVLQLSGQLGIRPGVMAPLVDKLVADGYARIDDEGTVRPATE